MEKRIALVEERLLVLEKVKEEFYEIKNSITKMEMVDNNIFDKLSDMNETMKAHKENFAEHDEKEMLKYGSIDRRLQKLEKIMYMAFGAGLLLQTLNTFHFINN